MRTIDEIISLAYTPPFRTDFLKIYVFGGVSLKIFNILTRDQQVLDMIEHMLAKYNGVEPDATFDAPFDIDEENGYVLYKGRAILKVRGWGYLTGVGGLHLDADTAKCAQDIFLKRFVKKMNQ